MNTTGSDTDKCRLCLSEHDKCDLTPIFTERELEMPLASRIMICLSLPVRAEDSFPDCVCKNCENLVTQFYAFRENCFNVYYSLLNRAIFSNRREKSCYLNKNWINPADESCGESEKVQFDESKPRLEQSTPRPVGEYDKNLSNQDINLRSSFERIPTECQEVYKLGEGIDTVDSEGNIPSENSPCAGDEDTNDEHPAEEKLQDEIDVVDESIEIIKYKCLHCDDLFSDIAAATIHCSECPKADADVLEPPIDTGQCPEENAHQLQENLKNREEIRKTCSNTVFRSSSDTTSGAKVQSKYRISSRITADLCKFKVPCSKSSTTIEKLSEPPSSHSCVSCESAFSSAAQLRRHSVVHTGVRPYECPICKKRFSQIGQLNFHKNFHENPRYRCEICKKPFLRPSDIAKHMRTHTGEKPYDCKICGKSFAQLVALQQHERIHTGDKPYVCEICDKRFSQKANKTKHVKIHKEGAKPHTCGICGRSFSDLEEMHLHRAGHGGGKPRKCDYCDESFRKTSELSQHTRRYHTFEKPHKCPFCQKAFYSLYNMKQHSMVHTGQKPYGCSLCDLKFTQKGNLTKHFERKHGDFKTSEDHDFFVKMEDNCSEDKEREIWMLANDLLKNTNDSLLIEREETVEEVETIDGSIG